MHLLLHLHLLHTLSIQLVGWYSLSLPAAFVPLSRLLEYAHPVQVLDSDELLLEVVTEELIEGAEAEDTLLLELAHQDLLHLFVRQFAVVVESHGSDSTFLVFIQL